MALSPRAVAPLLFSSGFCALIYQVTWTREFRLIFGASTAASAAVLAIFAGGLGVGGLWLGGRADQRRRPLEFYAQLEALVAVMAAVTPGLLWLARRLYTALGGTVVLGLGGGTALRLVLATLVLAGPTIAMGGTMPAAVRAVSSAEDEGRRGVALLYGVNTLGAVTGSVLSTFLLLEVFGAHLTLWMTCLVNLLVAVIALRMAREAPPVELDAPSSATDQAGPGGAKVSAEARRVSSFTLGAAAVTGFAFFLLELVWYRMLGPILGGSVFTFGLILALALLGIGLGGAIYGRKEQPTPTLVAVAVSCLLEAALIMLPFALGDRLAAAAQTLRGLVWMGFSGQVIGWSVVAGIVVLPAALVAGYQFPMLIALLGRGSERVGRQVGLAYAFNTAGAVLGSLAGGFGLMPALTAPGCWRLAAMTLVALGAVALVTGLRNQERAGIPAASTLLAGALALQLAQGPTAIWRHGGIGAGRSTDILSPSAFEARRRLVSGDLLWEREGVESSVALTGGDGVSFLVNGKSDGNAISDSATQVMAGLLGVTIHPDARRSLVIGLGTGSTAGWLGAVPSMERVDVVEIEPAIVPVARDCAPVNQHVLEQSKTHLLFADAREALLSSHDSYDIIFSEPSNPYRAGIASLFTQEFYRASAERLAPRGVFLQWVQGYEVSPQTVRTVLATLHSVFPVIDIWQLESNDLLLVASREPHPLDPARTRALVESEPLRSALAATWQTGGLEGLLSHHLAAPALADLVAQQEGENLNTDDLSPVEFGFARTAGRHGLFDKKQIDDVAYPTGLIHASLTPSAGVDLGVVELARILHRVTFGGQPAPAVGSLPEGPLRQRLSMFHAFLQGKLPQVREIRNSLPSGTSLLLSEQVLVADALARLGDEQALPLIESFASLMPLEAAVLRADLRAAQNRPDDAVELLIGYFRQHRTNPWVWPSLAQRPLQLAARLGADQARAARLLPELLEPFSVRAQDRVRKETALQLASRQPDPRFCLKALEPFEPFAPWKRSALQMRLDCYERAHSPLVERARDDMNRWLGQREAPFGAGIPLPARPAASAPVAEPAPAVEPTAAEGAAPAPAQGATPAP